MRCKASARPSEADSPQPSVPGLWGLPRVRRPEREASGGAPSAGGLSRGPQPGAGMVGVPRRGCLGATGWQGWTDASGAARPATGCRTGSGAGGAAEDPRSSPRSPNNSRSETCSTPETLTDGSSVAIHSYLTLARPSAVQDSVLISIKRESVRRVAPSG